MSVILRTLEDADMEWVERLYAEPHVQSALLWDQKQATRLELVHRLTAAEAGTTTECFAVLHGSPLEPVGTITLSDIHPIHRRATINNLAVFRGHAGVGIAAGQQLAAYAFRVKNLNRVDCRVWQGNRLTPQFCKLTGARHEGTARQYVYRDGQYIDVTMWSLLRDEYEPQSA